jgi:hypothetical protein
VGSVIAAVLFSLQGQDDAPSAPFSPILATTDVPSSSPTSGDPFVEELRSLIDLSADELLLFTDPTSPQSQALTWLKNDTIATSSAGGGRSQQTLIERYALAVFYYSTSGSKWVEYGLLNYGKLFLSDDSICTWYGVYCQTDNVTVDMVDFSSMSDLQGTLPWELFLLTNLEDLKIGYCPLLTGSISTTISLLTSLQVLSLVGNALTGSLPGRMPFNSKFVELSNNRLTGTIPPEFFTSLPKLELLRLTGNSLSGPLPTTLGQLSSLTEAYFHANRLTGTIPSELGQLSLLDWLVLYDNRFTGTVPSELAEIDNLFT